MKLLRGSPKQGRGLHGGGGQPYYYYYYYYYYYFCYCRCDCALFAKMPLDVEAS